MKIRQFLITDHSTAVVIDCQSFSAVKGIKEHRLQRKSNVTLGLEKACPEWHPPLRVAAIAITYKLIDSKNMFTNLVAARLIDLKAFET